MAPFVINPMSLAQHYRRQFAWRDWGTILAELPLLTQQTILDVGCGVGDVAAALVARGARVVGFDANEELLREARNRGLTNAEFRSADLRTIADFGVAADGLWCSFTAAYFPDLATRLTAWSTPLKEGGWIALTEIDDLFGHEPLCDSTKALLRGYAAGALAAGRYDFHMGRKLRDHLERAGFTVTRTIAVGDGELSFAGAARPEVIDAWRSRIDGMRLLRDYCGASFDELKEEFLGCLALPEHTCSAKVYACIAQKT
jgi:SAM-dependent methyltransferase